LFGLLVGSDETLEISTLDTRGIDSMSSQSSAKLEASIRDYILKEFLPGEDPAALTDSTPLITTGILDSLATLKLVAFLETHYQITIEPYEADAEHLNTVEVIAKLVRSKQG
jgi:acyl carrier protein